jgi:hypothetical protein
VSADSLALSSSLSIIIDTASIAWNPLSCFGLVCMSDHILSVGTSLILSSPSSTLSLTKRIKT